MLSVGDNGERLPADVANVVLRLASGQRPELPLRPSGLPDLGSKLRVLRLESLPELGGAPRSLDTRRCIVIIINELNDLI